MDEILNHMQHYQSSELNELYGALAKAQGEMQPAGKKSDNPYFKSKYADLMEVVRVSRIPLSKNGLCVLQPIIPNEEGHLVLQTRLGHGSGQWIESRIRLLPPKNDIQSLGSYISYLRRYAYASLVGVTVCNEDDDAEMSVAYDRTPKNALKEDAVEEVNYRLREESPEVINRDQMEQLEFALDGFSDIKDKVLSGLRIQHLADMPKSKFIASLERIREIKQLRKG